MPRPDSYSPILRLLLALFCACVCVTTRAGELLPTALTGHWFEVRTKEASGVLGALSSNLRTTLPAELPLTGGSFWRDQKLSIEHDGEYVIDFMNSSVIGIFEHYVYDYNGRLVARLRGGIQAQTSNPYLIRHGRPIKLGAGQYRVLTHVDSPFYLANPIPYVDTLEHYEQSIKVGNVLTLATLGVFVGLGIYYAVLAMIRRRIADVMYAFFIGANLVYNASALLVFPDVFGIHEFYLISFPILLSNMAYILFVSHLLEIHRGQHPRLWLAAKCVMGIMALQLVFALTHPHWSLEMDRYGVGMMLLFGFFVGSIRAAQKQITARLYLVANVAFLIPGMWSISLSGMQGVFTLYAEHLGLIAVGTEVMCLALVIAYQFAQIQRERMAALKRAQENLNIATTDPLTGLPNRLALEMQLSPMPVTGNLSVIDLDGLKHYNDEYGHARGDELLRAFARECTRQLPAHARLFRHGGDEFVVLSTSDREDEVRQALERAVDLLRSGGFASIDASIGTVNTDCCSSANELKHAADMRMYDNKRERKLRKQGSERPTW